MSEPSEAPEPTVVSEQVADRGSLSSRAAASRARRRAADGSDPAYTEHEKHFLHEVLTMALYVSLSLLAVLVASPTAGPEDNRVQEGLIVLGTGLALVLAHFVAFRMSTRLVNEGLLTQESVDLMKAQALGGLPVAVVAALPVFLLGEDPGELVAELLLLLLVIGVGYRTARYATTPFRALLYAGLVALVAIAVVLVKIAVGGH